MPLRYMCCLLVTLKLTVSPAPGHTGQSYVALSRASSMEGLQVLGFDARRVMAHPRVVEWSKTIEQAPADSS